MGKYLKCSKLDIKNLKYPRKEYLDKYKSKLDRK